MNMKFAKSRIHVHETCTLFCTKCTAAHRPKFTGKEYPRTNYTLYKFSDECKGQYSEERIPVYKIFFPSEKDS